jgi:glycosyltransferase involved in cell wall biosynthesis
MHILWQRLRLPLPVQAFTGQIDLFHSPDFVLPPVGRVATILTVHDLSFLRVPECYVPAFREYLERAMRRAVARSDRILADSKSTQYDLNELLDVDPRQVEVVYPGVESRFRPVGEADMLAAARARYNLPERFILGLGTLQPRKNFEGLVRAFAELLHAGGHRPEIADLYLVIAGGQGWMSEGIYDAVTRAGVEERVRFAGFVRDEDLPALYSLAAAFAFPSRYEGFGLPVLESMACGTPVVCADNSSLPEVVGEAALMVDAGDVDSLAGSLAQLLGDRPMRDRLINAGLERVPQFTWQTAARTLLGVYRSFA